MDFLQKLKPAFFALLQIIAAVAFGFYAMHFSQLGLAELKHLRQLERIPQVAIAGVIDGEIIIRGTIKSTGSYLKAPRSQTPSVYYHYLVERRCKDSDGNETWCTETSRHEFVPFVLEDGSGEINVSPSRRIDWTAPQRYRQRSGKYRYTEWRLEPGDQVHAIGWAQGKTLNFDHDGQYLPIISTDSVTAERGHVGHVGMLYLWLGVSLGLACVFCVMLLFRVHRVLVHVAVLTIGMVVFLTTDGLTMIRTDLLAAQQWFEQREQTASHEVQQLFTKNNLQWHGWQSLADQDRVRQWVTYADWQRMSAIYESLVLSQHSVKEQAQRLFGRLVLMGGASQQQPIPVFAWVSESALQQQTQIKSQIQGVWSWVELVVAGLLALGLGWWAIKSVRWKRMIENLPTSKIKGVMPGLTEIKGLIELQPSTTPLSSPLKNIPSVYYHYIVKEKRGSGKNSKWVTIVDDKQGLDFFCEDDTGKLLITDLDKAEVLCKRRYSKREGRRRYYERLIGTGDAVYALGSCRFTEKEQSHLKLAAGDKRDPFIVSNFKESEIMLKKARLGMSLLTAAFSAFMLLMLVTFGKSGDFAFSDIVLAGLMAPLFGVCLMLVLHYNDLIFLKQRVLRNWANVDVMLQKRFDLYNSLKPVVSESMAYEKKLLSLIAQARALSRPELGNTQALKSTIATQAEINKGLLALQEAYPELKSNELVKRFMVLMSTMETEISLIRAGYNDAVEAYNSRLQSFPDVLIAMPFKFSAAEFGRWE